MTDARIPDDWVVVAEAGSGTEANLIVGRLEEEGIEAIQLQAAHAPGAWMTGSQAEWAPKTVAVPVEYAEQAHSILAQEGLGMDSHGYASDDTSEEYEDEGDGSGQYVETIAEGNLTMMRGMRSIAWAIALLVLGGLFFSYCANGINL